jgi:RHS repeat-associated protein
LVDLEWQLWLDGQQKNNVWLEGSIRVVQGQYFDEETGLAFNRFWFYDPQSGRFVSKDPIGLLGGLSFQQYARNPIEGVDPFGLVNIRHTDPARDSLTGIQTRCRYLREESRIDSQLSHCKSPKERARLAHKLRNEARIRARLLVNDPMRGVGLYKGGEESGTGKAEPMLKWKDAVSKAQARGASGDDVYKSIEASSQKSRASVNKSLDGVDCAKELSGI